jgi:hypothetical protein
MFYLHADLFISIDSQWSLQTKPLVFSAHLAASRLPNPINVG